MYENSAAETKTGKIPETIPIRCSVCGKKLVNLYPDTLPGLIFATCQDGHKIRFRKENLRQKPA